MIRPDEIIAVSGSTRCGSSLMMRLLVAAGLPGLYNMATSFEHSGMLGLPGDASYLAGAAGHCTKLSEIQRYAPPAGPKYRVIYMTRDVHEQAKSQLKFLHYLSPELGVPANPPHAMMRRLAASIARDRGIDLDLWRHRYGAEVLKISFEHLLTRRGEACAFIAAFLGLDHDAIAKMSPLVIERTPKNYPGLMEIALMGKDPNA